MRLLSLLAQGKIPLSSPFVKGGKRGIWIQDFKYLWLMRVDQEKYL
jgi:hypothetical protein